MRKALIYGPRDLRLTEVPDPRPGPGQVLIRIKRASICHTDVNAYTGAMPIPYPRGFCHDASGVVEAVGAGVEGVPIGQAVTQVSWAGCKECRMCRIGKSNVCLSRPRVPEGAPEWAAELICVPAESLVPLPEGVTLDDAAVEEPFHTALNGRDILGYQEGDNVVVVGTGSMGWGQIQVAHLTGARVIGVDMLDERLEMARRFGAQHTLRADAPDLAERLRELCPEGVLFSIDATGLGKGLQLAIDLADEGARIGTLGAREPVGTHSLVTKQMALFGIRNGHQKRLALELIAAGKLDFKPAISHRYSFTRTGEALAHAAERPTEVTKCILEFD